MVGELAELPSAHTISRGNKGSTSADQPAYVQRTYIDMRPQRYQEVPAAEEEIIAETSEDAVSRYVAILFQWEDLTRRQAKYEVSV